MFEQVAYQIEVFDQEIKLVKAWSLWELGFDHHHIGFFKNHSRSLIIW